MHANMKPYHSISQSQGDRESGLKSLPVGLLAITGRKQEVVCHEAEGGNVRVSEHRITRTIQTFASELTNIGFLTSKAGSNVQNSA